MDRDEEKIIIAEHLAGQRLDKALTNYFEGKYSRSFLQRHIELGEILLNGQSAAEKHKVKAGDIIECQIKRQESALEIIEENIPLEIIHEDDELAVINKPSGLVVHPGAGHRSHTLVHALKYHFNHLSALGGPERLGIVHRLDKETSGIMVIAKTDQAHQKISKQFEIKTIYKGYRGFVKGILEHDNGIIDEPIGRHLKQRKRMAIRQASGRDALTHYHVIKRYANFTDVAFRLFTGRTHQIRVHMASIGHPIIGDKEYGSGMLFSRHALHSEKLGFTHPKTGEEMEFHCPMPEDMERFLDNTKKKSRHRASD